MGYQDLDLHQRALIDKHLQLVIKANETTNLTRIDTVDSGMLLHIEDSLSALPEFENAPAGKYIDIGSGGGFPGIPIAIATGRSTTLLDARNKKVDLLNEFALELGLSEQIIAVHARIEEFSASHKNQYAVVSARALSKLSILMEFASPLLKQGGQLICYKARIDDDEYLHAKKIAKQVGMEIKSKRSFELSDNKTQRCIVMVEKVSAPRIKLPRKDGFAQNKPL